MCRKSPSPTVTRRSPSPLKRTPTPPITEEPEFEQTQLADDIYGEVPAPPPVSSIPLRKESPPQIKSRIVINFLIILAKFRLFSHHRLRLLQKLRKQKSRKFREKTAQRRQLLRGSCQNYLDQLLKEVRVLMIRFLFIHWWTVVIFHY